jgi:hypothetical protein
MLVMVRQNLMAQGLKVAVTLAAPETVHELVPLQAPPQPPNTLPASGEAFNVTLLVDRLFQVPWQVPGQLIPDGLLETDPDPLPAVETLTV